MSASGQILRRRIRAMGQKLQKFRQNDSGDRRRGLRHDVFSLSRADAQAPVSLQEQLAAQYKMVKMGSDTQRIFGGRAGHTAGHSEGRNSGRALFRQAAFFRPNMRAERCTLRAADSVEKGSVSDMGEIWEGRKLRICFRWATRFIRRRSRSIVEQGHCHDEHRGLRHLQQDRSADLQQGASSVPVSQGISGKGERG